MRYDSLLQKSKRLCRISIFALLASLTMVVGCDEDSVPAATRKVVLQQIRSGNFDMGRGVYMCLAKHSGACQGAVYRRNRNLVIDAVNALMGPLNPKQIPAMIEKLYPLIDNGTLPGTINDVKSVLNILKCDQKVMKAVCCVSNGPSPVSASLSMKMIGQLLSYPEIDKLINAFAQLINADDGRMINGLLRFASSSLMKMGKEMQEPETEEAKESRRSLARELLRELDGVSAGPSVTIPRLNDDGSLLTETVTKEEAYTNYGDQPADGEASDGASADGDDEVSWDMGGVGDQPLPNTDYTGELGGFLGGLLDGVEWPAELILAVNGFTADGLNKIGKLLHNGTHTYAEDIMGRLVGRRAPATSGHTLRPTIEMNKTVLAVLMRSLGEAVKADLHSELSTFLKCALGEKVGNGYSPTNPLAEMQYGQLEIFKYTQAPKLLDGLAMTLQTDPELGEALLAKVLRLVALVKGKDEESGDGPAGGGLLGGGPGIGAPGNFGGTVNDEDEGDSELLTQNLRMLDQLFKTPVQGSSTGRVVVDVITRLGDCAKLLPQQLAAMFKYRKMVRGDNGDGNLIDEERSIEVDRSKPAFYVDSFGAEIDNRSCFHRLVKLVKTTNACKIPVLNKSLAYVHHEMLAELTPATAGLVNDLLVTIGEGGGIGDLICAGLKGHVVALKELTTTGAMDALIPLMKAFKDNGQLQLFIDLLIVMSPTYEDNVRPGEEGVIEMLESGALEVVFDLLSLSNTITIPGTDEVVADVVVDFLGDLLNHDTPVINIFGEERPAKVYLLMDPMKRLSKQLAGTPGEEALNNLIDKGIDIFLGVEHHDADTPDDPSDDFDTVGNKFIVPLLSRFLSVAAQDLERDPVKRIQDLEKDQRELGESFGERAFVDMVEFLEYYCNNENRKLFDDALVYFLTPHENPSQNLFGSLLMVVGMMLQTQADNVSMGEIMQFVGRLIDPDRGYVQRLVKGIFSIIEADDGKVLIGLLRRGFTSYPQLKGDTPFGVMFMLSQQIKDRCTGAKAALTIETLTQIIDEMLSALAHADAVFYMILNRVGGPGGGNSPDHKMMYNDPDSYMYHAARWSRGGKVGAYRANKRRLGGR